MILIECKNWTRPVGSSEVAWFDRKLADRALPEGILVAAAGITGSGEDLDRSHRIIATSLSQNRKLLVITLAELIAIGSTEALVEHLKVKLLKLAIRQTSLV